PPRAQNSTAQRAAPRSAEHQHGPHDSSIPQDALGQTATQSAREAQQVAHARTIAHDPVRSPHRSLPQALHAAKACNPHTAQKAAKAPPRAPRNAPHSSQTGPEPTAQATNRPPLCDAAQAKARARSLQAHKDAPETEAHTQDQMALATHQTAPTQAPLPPPHLSKAADIPPPISPAAVPLLAQETPCVGSRAAQQHHKAQLPGPIRSALRAAVPPAGSCSSHAPLPADPKTTAEAANTTTAAPQAAQPHATAHAPPPQHPTASQAHKPSAPQTGCGPKPQRQSSNGCD